jgi:hypothetical protein
MLEIRPICENCGKELPNESNQAMICTFECTFCVSCVEHVLHNVCPNCGGGFEKRPSRPVTCVTRFCVTNYPASKEKKLSPVDVEKLKKLQEAFEDIDPRKR